MKALAVIDSAATTLFDADHTYWPLSEKVLYLNEGRQALALARPDLYQVQGTLTLAAGVRQTLPAGASKLLRITHNVSHADRFAITPTSEAGLARFIPHWRADTQQDEVLHYLYDETEARSFDVYPPAKAGVQVAGHWVATPAAIAQADLATTELEPERELAIALIEYVCARAFAKEGESNPALLERSQGHMQRFAQMVGAEAQAKTATSPNTTAPGARAVNGVGQ